MWLLKVPLFLLCNEAGVKVNDEGTRGPVEKGKNINSNLKIRLHTTT